MKTKKQTKAKNESSESSLTSRCSYENKVLDT